MESAESPEHSLDLKISRKRKRSGQLRSDFVHPAGPGELPWAWRLADTLSTPRRSPVETRQESLPKQLEAKPKEPKSEDDSLLAPFAQILPWEPFFRDTLTCTLPEQMLEKNVLPWAWRLPFACEP
ncbi:unnamed protein product [Durusdinium trenchii]|uniref:Uncharacterized protein n=1 Tax=Durusdinium trenchii TaxID=1381693 RepID=A0ABP0QS72_9DINO